MCYKIKLHNPCSQEFPRELVLKGQTSQHLKKKILTESTLYSCTAFPIAASRSRNSLNLLGAGGKE